MGFFKSKKFTAFIVGLIALALTELAGVSEQIATQIAGIMGAYLLGQGVADGLSKGATSNVATKPVS